MKAPVILPSPFDDTWRSWFDPNYETVGQAIARQLCDRITLPIVHLIGDIGPTEIELIRARLGSEVGDKLESYACMLAQLEETTLDLTVRLLGRVLPYLGDGLGNMEDTLQTAIARSGLTGPEIDEMVRHWGRLLAPQIHDLVPGFDPEALRVSEVQHPVETGGHS